MNPTGRTPYVISSLTRRLVWRLQLLLGLASAVILGFESCASHDHILLSQIWDPATRRAKSPYSCPPARGGPVKSSGNGLPFPRLLRLAELRWRYLNPPTQVLRISTHFRLIAPPYKNRIEDTASNNSYIVALMYSLQRGRFSKLFPSNCRLFCLFNPGFQRYVKILFTRVSRLWDAFRCVKCYRDS
jgi:hypothetical protein